MQQPFAEIAEKAQSTQSTAITRNTFSYFSSVCAVPPLCNSVFLLLLRVKMHFQCLASSKLVKERWKIIEGRRVADQRIDLDHASF